MVILPVVWVDPADGECPQIADFAETVRTAANRPPVLIYPAAHDYPAARAGFVTIPLVGGEKTPFAPLMATKVMQVANGLNSDWCLCLRARGAYSDWVARHGAELVKELCSIAERIQTLSEVWAYLERDGGDAPLPTGDLFLCSIRFLCHTYPTAVQLSAEQIGPVWLQNMVNTKLTGVAQYVTL